jgi:hypothetical protein
MALRDVHREIARLGGYGGTGPEPLLSLELFFEGNDDEGSIAPNLGNHPGVAHFASVLLEIRARPDVDDVLVGVSEVMSEDEWPYASHVYVVTSAPERDVDEWVELLVCDPPGDGWWNDAPPVNAPPIPGGSRIVMLWWD